MALHRPEIAGGDRLGPLREGRTGRSLLDQDLVSDVGVRPQRGSKLFLFRQARPLAPLRTKAASGPHCRPFVVGDNGEKILNAHNLRAELSDGGFVNQNKPGADRRRPDHAGVQHAPRREIVDVDVASSAFGRHVRPWQGLGDDAVSGGILEPPCGQARESWIAVALGPMAEGEELETNALSQNFG